MSRDGCSVTAVSHPIVFSHRLVVVHSDPESRWKGRNAADICHLASFPSGIHFTSVSNLSETTRKKRSTVNFVRIHMYICM